MDWGPSQEELRCGVSVLAREGRSLDGLADLVRNLGITCEQVRGLLTANPLRPYGRRVLFGGPGLEVMVARWTPGQECAPHDHGGSVGVVQVLQGHGFHRVWSVSDGVLEPEDPEHVVSGDLLYATPELIHSMGDAGASEPLVTLHFYVDVIPNMVVYDVAGRRSLVVDSGCGAWVPHDQPELILQQAPGFVSRGALESWT
ncbi:MAG: cysteine dioxygenase family protein [Myxococcota bacterium]|nr:cysteine dioxygenase family protein [Myxococcota bacterium]